MKRGVTVISLRQFESAGGLAEGYSFEDFSCPLNEGFPLGTDPIGSRQRGFLNHMEGIYEPAKGEL